MARDDSALFTGATSASFGSVRSRQLEIKREELKKTKTAKKNVLSPVSKLIIDEILAEKKAVMFVKNIDFKGISDERAFMVEMLARKRYVQYLDVLKNKIAMVLKEEK